MVTERVAEFVVVTDGVLEALAAGVREGDRLLELDLELEAEGVAEFVMVTEGVLEALTVGVGEGDSCRQ